MVKRNPDGTFPPGVSGNPTGRKPGTAVSKAAQISKVISLVLGVPLEDTEKRKDGYTNYQKLQKALQEAFEKKPTHYLTRLVFPIAQLLTKTSLQIDIQPKQPLRITLTGNGHGGNGQDKGGIIDVSPNEGEGNG